MCPFGDFVLRHIVRFWFLEWELELRLKNSEIFELIFTKAGSPRDSQRPFLKVHFLSVFFILLNIFGEITNW